MPFFRARRKVLLVYFSVCFWQLPPFLAAGVRQSASAQCPFPAGHDCFADTLAGAACNGTCVHATAAFAAEILAKSTGGAKPDTEHCVLLFPPCFDAMFRRLTDPMVGPERHPSTWHGALSISTMPETEAACCCKTAAVFRVAQFLPATAMQGAPSSCYGCSGATAEGAEPWHRVSDTTHEQWSGQVGPSCSMLRVKPTCIHESAAACSL